MVDQECSGSGGKLEGKKDCKRDSKNDSEEPSDKFKNFLFHKSPSEINIKHSDYTIVFFPSKLSCMI